MRESWRWFGEHDAVSLDDIRQAGATDVVCALYDVSAGEAWTINAIQALKRTIEADNGDKAPLRWSVVESIPLHEDIKLGRPTRDAYIESWTTTLKHLANCGIEVVCYNFMPVIDWTRTDLHHRLPTGAYALRFDQRDYAAFDLHILKRTGAENDYSASEVVQAQHDFDAMSEDQRKKLTNNIVAGLPGHTTDSYDLAQFAEALCQYDGVDRETLENNLAHFLDRVVPVAEAHGIRLAIHPDDPPWSLFGLPRVVCNAEDVDRILTRHNSRAHGVALCAGTFGSDINNDVPQMARQFGSRVYFAHLRSVEHDLVEPRTFLEASHLEGDVDLIRVIRNLLQHEQNAADGGDIFIRPDHGHQMMDDLDKTVKPGYSAIGRLKGLAEMRGVIRTLESTQRES